MSKDKTKGGQSPSTGAMSASDAQSLLAAAGIDLSTIGAGTSSADPVSALSQALAGSVFQVTGEGPVQDNLGGGIKRTLDRKLPAWVKTLAPDVVNNDLFDPYYGNLAVKGDEMVYMGVKAPAAPKENHNKAKAPADSPSGDLGGMSESLMWKTIAKQNDPNRPKAKVEDAQSEMEQQFSGPYMPPARDESKQPDNKTAKSGGQNYQIKPTPHVEPAGPQYSNRHDKVMTVQQVMNQPYMWSEAERLDTMKKMRAAGYNIQNFEDMVGIWGQLVSRASTMYALSEGTNKVTPWDVLDLSKTEMQAAGSYTNYQNGTQSVVHKNINQFTEGAAWSGLQQMLSRMLGRDPSDQEVRDFVYKMNQAAARNPEISKTISTFKNGKVVDESTRVTNAGFDSNDLMEAAYKGAQHDKNYAEHQAATTYFNALTGALGALGGGGNG